MRALALLCFTSCAFAQQYVISTLAGGTGPVTPSRATGAAIGDPPRVVADRAGNIYFSSLHSIFRVDSSGTLTRVAGNGKAGNTGDLGAATNAQLNYPMGMAFDPAGNLYVADRDANVVRRISGGVITTVATGLNQPYDVAVDSRGSVFVADTGNHRVVRIGADGSLVDAAGTGGVLNAPEGLAVDANDNLYIADTFNGRIRQLTSDGRLTTIAGTGSTGVFAGDDGPAVDAALSLPTAVAVDAQGTVYVADYGNGRIRTIVNGVITTVVGSSTGGPIVEGGPAASTRLIGPTGTAVDRNGTLFFVESGVGSGNGQGRGDFRIWKVDAGELRTVAGTGTANYGGDGGPASAAQLNAPTAMQFDGSGNLYIADTENHRVRRISADGTIATVLGTGTPGFSVEFGSPDGAMFHSPRGVAFNPAGDLLVSDSGNNRARRYQQGGNLSTYVGNGNASYFGDGGPADRASINQQGGIVMDAAGDLYIADTLDNAVRKVTPAGIITTIAGTGPPGSAGDGGPAVRAQLDHPRAVAVDAAGNVYVTDSGNNRVRRVDTSGTITTIAGNGAPDFFPGDSAGTASSLSDPRGVAVDAAGNVYISDTGHNRIRKLFPSGAITTIAGYDGECCYSGDGSLAASARLNRPEGLLMTAAGMLYVADTGNDAIRSLRPVTANVSVAAVTNAASNLGGSVAPGELITIWGTGLDGVTRVTIGSIAAPVLYSTTTQAGAIVPYGVTGASAPMTIVTAGGISAPFTLSIATVSPGLFTADSSGQGQALAINQDGSRNGSGRPAAAGEMLTLFVTGEGQTNPPGIDGQVNGSPAPVPLAPVSVTIGGAPADVLYAGGVPGQAAGVMQVNVRVPGRAFGTLPVVVSVARVPTQEGATVVVR